MTCIHLFVLHHTLWERTIRYIKPTIDLGMHRLLHLFSLMPMPIGFAVLLLKLAAQHVDSAYAWAMISFLGLPNKNVTSPSLLCKPRIMPQLTMSLKHVGYASCCRSYIIHSHIVHCLLRQHQHRIIVHQLSEAPTDQAHWGWCLYSARKRWLY